MAALKIDPRRLTNIYKMGGIPGNLARERMRIFIESVQSMIMRMQVFRDALSVLLQRPFYQPATQAYKSFISFLRIRPTRT